MRVGLQKHFYVTLVMMFVMIFLLTPFCYAQESEQTDAKAAFDRPTVNINISLYSQYIWRGYELSHDSFVMFPSVTVSYKGFSVNWWGDVDTDFAGKPDSLQCMEQDYSAWYSNSWQNLNYTFGYIHYNTKNNSHFDTQEIWVALGLIMFLNPTFSVCYDIEDSGSWYNNLALSHSFPISKDRFNLCRDWSFDVGGWMSYYWQKDYMKEKVHYSAWHDGNVWAGLKIPLSDVCSITAKIQYSFPLGHKADKNIQSASFDGNDSQFVYGGLVFDYTF